MKQSGLALQFVKKQTVEICLEAVKQNVWSLKYIKEQTPKICLELVKEKPELISQLENRDDEIFLTTIRLNPNVFKKIKKNLPSSVLDEAKAICDLWNGGGCINSYRQIRSQLTSMEIDFKESHYPVLEQLYPY